LKLCNVSLDKKVAENRVLKIRAFFGPKTQLGLDRGNSKILPEDSMEILRIGPNIVIGVFF